MTKLPIPFGNPRTYAGHSGVDYPQARGTIFRASGKGTVTLLGANERGGNYIWVKYDAADSPVGYHHMDSHRGCPPVGARVQEGTMLGYVGSLGKYSTGPHLHSEVSGHATTAGYWLYFDPSRVVGSGIPSGGGTEPPTPTPTPYHERQDDMFQIKIKDNDGRYGPPSKWYYAIIGANFLNLDGPYTNDGGSEFANVRSRQFGVPAFNCDYWKWEQCITDSGKRQVWDDYLKSIGKLPRT